MRRIIERFFVLLAFAGVFFTSAAQAQVSMRVVVFGDSLVSGYHIQKDQAFAARLEQKLKEMGYTGVQVINAAQEGMTTAMAIDPLNSVIEMQPDVVVLGFGTDDLARGVAVEQTYTNLAFMANKLSAANSYVVLLGVRAPSSLGYSIVKQYESMYKQVASLRGALLIPDIMERISGNTALTLSDDIHPNDRGVDMMVEAAYRYVDSCLRTKLQNLQYEKQYKAYQQELIGR